MSDKSRNTITSICTAFNTYAELVAACRGGYVPTIRPGTFEHQLVELLTIDGFRCWNPQTGKNW